MESTNSYVAVRIAHDQVLMTIYFSFRDSRTALVAACWNNVFDSLPLATTDDLEDLAEDYPIIAALVLNAIAQRYSQCALIRMEDYDNGDMKWFMVTVAGNINADAPDDDTWTRLFEALDRVTTASFGVMNAIQDGPSTLQVVGRSVWRGIKRGLRDSVKISLEVTLDTVFSSSSSTPPGGAVHHKTFEQFVGGMMNERARRGLPPL